MATLQYLQQRSAFSAKTRLQQITRELPTTPAPASAPKPPAAEAVAAPTAPIFATAAPDQLSIAERHQLLMQTVSIYEEWFLAGVHSRANSDVLVAYLVRANDRVNAKQAIQEGRALQIMMDAMGDMTISHPRHHTRSLFGWLWKQLKALFLLDN